MTKGEYRVGIGFNPSGDDMVTRIKRAAAGLIDMIEDIEPPVVSSGGDYAASNNEVARLKALAQTAIEDGAMWAVKAATKREPGA